MIYILDDENILESLIKKAFPEAHIRVFRKTKHLLEALKNETPEVILLDNLIKRGPHDSPSDYLSDDPNKEGFMCFIQLKRSHPHLPVFLATRYLEPRFRINEFNDFYIELADVHDPDRKNWIIELIRRRLSPYIDTKLSVDIQKEFREYGFITRNKEVIDELAKIRKLLNTDEPIVLNGETGVGKDLLANIIHRMSNRADKPFKNVYLSYYTDGGLFKSDFFGHVKGAYTGADSNKEGILEKVKDGTLILNQLESTTAEIQGILLEVIESRTFSRMGQTKERKFYGRFVFVTNKDLTELVETGKFRKDLFFRLENNIVKIPPLRERRDDIDPLIEFFVGKFYREGQTLQFSSKAIDWLVNTYEFPGNVRELKNLIRYFANQEIKFVDLGYLWEVLSDERPLTERRDKKLHEAIENIAEEDLWNLLVNYMQNNKIDIKKLKILLFCHLLKMTGGKWEKSLYEGLGFSHSYFFDNRARCKGRI